jgi:hypothetical protein
MLSAPTRLASTFGSDALAEIATWNPDGVARRGVGSWLSISESAFHGARVKGCQMLRDLRLFYGLTRDRHASSNP